MIDWTRVAELRTEIGDEDFAEVVTLFLEEADEAVQGLAGCQAARALESTLHFLKGSALNLGFQTLARLCQDGERRAAAGEAGIDVSAIASAYESSKISLAAGRAAPGDSRAA